MNLKQAIENRSSARKFTAEKVQVEDLKELVRRAGMAPSVNNSQPWTFYVVTNGEKIATISDFVRNKVRETVSDRPENVQKTVEYFSTLFENAPAVIFVASESYSAVADIGDDKAHEALNIARQYPDIQSIGAAVENMLLTAVELELGACWLSGLMVARREIEQVLGIVKPLHLITAVAVGKIESEPRKRDRKPLEEIFHLVD